MMYPSDPSHTLVVACVCEETTCATCLELTPDGILAIEDIDGQRLSILLPDWLDDAMRNASAAHVLNTTDDSTMTSADHTSWPVPTVAMSDQALLDEWLNDGICEATDGCPSEPDGSCGHGHPSWLLQLGLI